MNTPKQAKTAVTGTRTFSVTPSSSTSTFTNTPTPPPADPNQLLHYFLESNNLRLTVTAIEDENPFVGTGFILTQKPLLKISVEYK